MSGPSSTIPPPDRASQAVRTMAMLEQSTAARAARLQNLAVGLDRAQGENLDTQLRHFAGSPQSTHRGGNEEFGRTMATTSQYVAQPM